MFNLSARTLFWTGIVWVFMVNGLQRARKIFFLISFSKVRCHVGNVSINSKRWQTPGEFFWGGQKPCPGAKFSCKSTAPGAKTPTRGEYFKRSCQPFLLTGVEILGFYRNQTLKRIGKLSNHSLVIPSNFSLSAILKSFKVFPQLSNRFCN